MPMHRVKDGQEESALSQVALGDTLEEEAPAFTAFVFLYLKIFF